MHAIHVPQEHVNDESVLLIEWLVADGERVDKGRALATIETSKATFEVEASFEGYVRLNQKKGSEVRIGDVLCYLTTEPSILLSSVAVTSGQIEIEASAARGNGESIGDVNATQTTRFSRKAIALLKEHGLLEEQFRGRGLIKSADVLGAISRPKTIPAEPVAKVALPGNVPFRVEELPRRKRLEARLLESGQNTIASVISVICPTRGLRAAARRHPELSGGPLPLLIHETARLLRKYPIFNAFHADDGIHYYEVVGVGFAVDADRGLKVPVISGADTKSITQIRTEMEDLVADYLNNTLPVESIEGGTFTISDLSGEDVYGFVPLINQAQAAILGIGAEYFPPGSRDGVFSLQLAFDHRLAEGRIAAAFLRDLRDRIQSYERALRGNESSIRVSDEPCCAHCLRPASELGKLKIRLLQEIQQSGKMAPICLNCVLGY